MTALEPAVSLHGVGLSFGANAAVRDISLDISPGEIVTLVGPSGCGKSSILRLISGLQTHSAGTIKIAEGQTLSFVFQDAALLPWASVARNVMLPLSLDGGEDLALVNECLAQVGLADRRDAHPAELSGGMRMRVSIARALVRRPTLLLMDEPFAALDELRRFDLAQQVRQIAKTTGLTVIFVTHSVFEACFLSDRVIVLSASPGTIVESISLDDDEVRSADFRESQAFADACNTVSLALRAAAGEDL
ncbi:MAG: ABC transporter ATP-binding protein [Pseudomonadota bacterium]